MTETLSFAAWLSKRRKQLGYTQQSLADRVNCSFETIRRIEAGSRKPSEQLATLLAEALLVPTEEIEPLVRRARSQPSGELSKPPAPRHDNLPHQLTSFVGREKEVAAITDLLSRQGVSLVTLTGAGGSGKTRLALQVGTQQLEAFPDGVCFVNLAPITDPGLVAATIAHALGVQVGEAQSIDESLKSYLSEKQQLLLLDNFEQVVDAAPLVSEILATAPHIKVLVTSREPLRLQGEHNFPVPPLSLPDPEDLRKLVEPDRLGEYEAIRLFAERASAHKPEFQLTNQNAKTIAEICFRLDGLPLAIELAAARIPVLPPQAMLARMQDQNRLDLLTAGARDLPARQQTLRNTIEWSYDLLSPEEQRLFRRLAAFQGGRTLEAIEKVCNVDGDLGSDIELLDRVQFLVSKSLVEQREGHDRQPGFWMLETIQAFAREKLEESGEAEELYKRHARYFACLVEEAEAHLTGREQIEWLNRLEDDYNNVRAALSWSRNAGREAGVLQDHAADAADAANALTATPLYEALETGLRIAGAVCRFWETRGYISEGREELGELLVAAGVPADRRGTDRLGADRGGVDKASEVQSGDVVRPPEGTSRPERSVLKSKTVIKALNSASRLAYLQRDYAHARLLAEQGLAMARELQDEPSTARSLSLLGSIASNAGDIRQGQVFYEETLQIQKTLGNERGIADSIYNLGTILYAKGEFGEARSLCEQSLAIHRKLGNDAGIARSLLTLGIIAYAVEDYPEARSLFEQSLLVQRQLRDKKGMAITLSLWLGNVLWRQGNRETARTLHEGGLQAYRELGDNWHVAYWFYRQGLWAYEEGDYQAARSPFEQGLFTWREVGNKLGIAVGLAALGGLAAMVGRWERSAVLLGAAEALRVGTGTVWAGDERVPYEQGLATSRTNLGEEAFERALWRGRAMGMEQAIEYALEDQTSTGVSSDA